MIGRRLVSAVVVIGIPLLTAGAGCAFDDSSEDVKKYNPAVDGGLDATSGDGAVIVPTQDLCGKMGGLDNVKKISTNMIAKVSADCRIGPYMTNLSAAVKKHHDECFATYLASAFQCKDAANAAILYIGSKDSAGQACGSITATHAQLNLTKSDYAAFEDDLNSSMTADNVETSLRQSVLSVLRGQPGVYNANKSGNAMCTVAACQTCVPVVAIDAGVDSGDGGKDSGDAAPPVDAGVDTGAQDSAASADAADG